MWAKTAMVECSQRRAMTRGVLRMRLDGGMFRWINKSRSDDSTRDSADRAWNGDRPGPERLATTLRLLTRISNTQNRASSNERRRHGMYDTGSLLASPCTMHPAKACILSAGRREGGKDH